MLSKTYTLLGPAVNMPLREMCTYIAYREMCLYTKKSPKSG